MKQPPLVPLAAVTLALLLLPLACHHEAGQRARDIAALRMPHGFRFAVYADNVPGARSLAITPKGVLFVGTRDHDKVYAVLDNDGDHRADEVLTIASGLHVPNGVAFHDGDLYIAEVSRVLKLPDIEAHLRRPPPPVVVNDSFPTDEHHGWKFIRFGPDGWLYVPVGAPCNVCERKDPRYASLMRMKPDGSELSIYARGIRNTVGFDWHPQSGELWLTENGRDRMGDDLPADELDHAPKPGMHFGFPYCHQGDLPDPSFSGHSCAEFAPPAIKLGPHVAALGMRFYTGSMFPPEYKNQIFIAEHGSWNRSQPIGYRVSLVRLQGSQAVSYQPFVDGFLRDGKSWARPVDVEVAPDGALLVSDDRANAIYRISYQP